MLPPETRYADRGGVKLAYQTFGEGPRDIVLVWGTWSHVELAWEVPGGSRFLRRLGALGRVIHFDRRGSGLSDPVDGAPTLEERMDDVRAVMDAAGCTHADIVAVSEGGPLAILLAASEPERVASLVLYGAFARIAAGPDHPFGIDPDVGRESIEAVVADWGGGVSLGILAPSQLDDQVFCDGWRRFERYSLSPGMFRKVMMMNMEIDVRAVLPSVHVPSLVLHRRGDALIPIEAGRELAAAMPGSRFVELEGDAHLFLVDPDQIVDEIEELLTGERPVRDSNRVLATVLFTDIVDSTSRAVDAGDSGWSALLDVHDAVAAREIARHGGRFVKSTGDGILATFDGPTRAMGCATAVRDQLRTHGLEIRAGVHTGEIERRGDDIGGVAVHVAARVSAAAATGEVLVSRTVVDLAAGSGIEFIDRGDHQLKGVPGSWQLFAATPGGAPPASPS